MEAVFLGFVLMLSIFLGFELISKVPATLHTPLMSGANAISGITLVGALTSAGAGLDVWAGGFLRHHQRGGWLHGDRPDAQHVQEEG